jgi:hypothetical protein
MPDLQSASREELIALIETLLARVAELEEEVRRLRAGHGGSSALAVKPNRPAREQKERKHRGRAFVRRREVQPDEVRTHAVESCPECGRALTGGWEHSRRQVIDIICRSWVTEHVLVRRCCGVCQKEWVPQGEASDYGVQGKRRFGASLQSSVATLHIGCRLPLRMIGKLLHETCGVHVSSGEMVKLLDGVKQAGEGNNIFVAECKFWKGAASLAKAADQLLSYTTWRDTKTALILLSRNAGFTTVLEKAPEVLRGHPAFKRELPPVGETQFRFVLGRPGDPSREVMVALVMFDVPRPPDSAA